jgi:hypothetical protein
MYFKLTFNIDTPSQKKRFAENPDLYLKYSKMIESELNQRFKMILNGTPEALEAKEVSYVLHVTYSER